VQKFEYERDGFKRNFMKPRIKASFPSISSKDLDTFEKEMTKSIKNRYSLNKIVTLPDDFRSFLLESNGGLPTPCHFNGDLNEVSLYDTFFYGYYPGYHSSVNLWSDWSKWMDIFNDLSENESIECIENFENEVVIPLASTGGWEDLVMVLTGPKKGYLYMTWPDEYEAMATSFSDFIINADYGAKPYDFETLASMCKHTNNCKSLLDYLEANQFNKKTLTQMMSDALFIGCFEALKKIYENGISLPDSCSLGNATSIEMASFLLGKGLELNKPDKNGFTPLEELIAQGNLPVIQYLVEKGADLKYVNPLKHRSPLKFAQERMEFFDQKWPYNYSEEKEVLSQIIIYLGGH
jgi:hypothetical protein